MNKYVGSWKFYKKVLLIAVPVMIQNLITNFVALIDNIMVGQVGTAQMSGVAIVNQLLFVFTLAVFGSISGAGIFCAQFFGKGDQEGVRHTFRFKLMTVAVILAIGLTVFLLFGDNLIGMYLNDTAPGIDVNLTLTSAKNYLKIMLIGLFPFAIEQAYAGTLREGGIATVPMLSGVAAVITNTLLNWLLIFGVAGFPELGVEGAAIATVISRFVQAFITILWTHTAGRKKCGYVKSLYRSAYVPMSLVKTMMKKGVIPLTANEILWSAGIAMLAQCYSTRGLDVVAANNISTTVCNLMNVLYIAFASGVAVVVGQLLGANNLKGAKEAAPKLIFFSCVLCIAVGAVAALCSGMFPKIYNTEPHVRTLAAQFILINSLLMPIHGMLHCSYFIMRAGGKTGITFAFDAGFSWLVSVPLAFVLAHFTGISILPLYICCQCVEIIKLFVGLVLIKKGWWLSNIVGAEKEA